MNPRGMVLDSVRFPIKHRGRRELHSAGKGMLEENIMFLQNQTDNMETEGEYFHVILLICTIIL